MLKGSTPSGATIGSADFGCVTICTPQNSQRPATSGGTNNDFAPQLWHCTSSAFCASWPNCSGRSRRYCSNGRSSTCPALSATASLCPQYGHVMNPSCGSNSKSAPQDGHGN